MPSSPQPLTLFFLFLFLHHHPVFTCPVLLSRIVGGHPALNLTLAFLASLSHPNNTFACTATLISPTWVLTAAHCSPTKKHLLRISPTRAESGLTIPIKNVIIHPQYIKGKFDSPGDVALIQLSFPITSNQVRYVLLNHNRTIPLAGAFARTAGYGRQQFDMTQLNPPPYQVDSPINSAKKCHTHYKTTLNVAESLFICAGYGLDGCQAEACSGDSGGPLIQYTTSGDPVQIGIVSFGTQCGKTGVPGVYVRMDPYVGWMRGLGVDVSLVRSEQVSQVFGEGSETAASDQVSSSQSAVDTSDNLVINRVWFVVICVIAAIALIGLIFLSFAFVAGKKEGSQSSRGERSGGDLPVHTLQKVIKNLQDIVDSADKEQNEQGEGEHEREERNEAGAIQETKEDVRLEQSNIRNEEEAEMTDEIDHSFNTALSLSTATKAEDGMQNK